MRMYHTHTPLTAYVMLLSDWPKPIGGQNKPLRIQNNTLDRQYIAKETSNFKSSKLC